MAHSGLDLGMGSGLDSWSILKAELQNCVQDIRRSTYLCIEDKSKHLFIQDLNGLDASVKALERQVSDLKALLKREYATIPKVEALLQACQSQEADLQMLASNLPARLPQLPSHAGAQQQQALAKSMVRSLDQDVKQGAAARDTAPMADKPQKPRNAPRAYVTESELQSVASYMRGRLTLDKVNAALDELVGCADANARLLATARTSSSKLAPPDRKRATELMHSVVNKEGVKGRFFVLESDLKDGTALKLDKTGRSILTLLRHLNRLQEVRCPVEGVSNTIYVLQSNT